MMSIRFSLSLLASVLLLSTAFAAETYNQDIPVPPQTVNPCNGETVDLTGTVHVLGTMTTDSSGGTHLVMQDNAQAVQGIGETSGAMYTFASNSIFTVNAKPPYPSEFTFSATMRVTSQGSIPNFSVQALFKVTVNADGTLTVAIFGFSSTCNG